mmetsp:Transcript_4148/g.7937  ORF Transcript_4148/g.7937 Transcript_4148/m.7937 type:complete len:426 (+) Transcript_4148:288-1565(+)
MKTARTFSLLLLIKGLSLGLGATYPNNPDSDPPSQWSSMSTSFQQHCSPFGISIFSLPSNRFPRDKFLHVCNMMAQFLDNDQDGCADDVNVVKMMRLNQAGLVLMDSENDAYYEDIVESFDETALFASQVRPFCSGSSETSTCRDVAIEEVLDFIAEYGISPFYHNEFGQCYDGNFQQRSELQVQMDIARGGHFIMTPSVYPANATFTYDDWTCNYDCMTEEFFYYALTSLLGGQDARAARNMDEWKASTPQDLQTKLPGMYNLLTGGVTSMQLLSADGVLPGSGNAAGATATYNPSSQTCSSGCGLDGSGCGELGNIRGDVNHCSNEGTTFEPSPSCVDSPLTMLMNGKQRTCAWAARNTSKRCARKGVSDHCPSTCNGNCAADSGRRFAVNGKFKRCSWVARKNTAKRCGKNGVKETCRKTCA